MLRYLLIRWTILALAIGLAAALIDDVEVSGGTLALIGVSILFSLVNATIGPVLRLVTLPLTIVTLGIFALVINGVLLALTAGLSDALSVGGFWSTVWAALLISVFSALLNLVFERKAQR